MTGAATGAVTRAERFDWYILVDGAPAGPVTAAALTSFLMSGKLTSGDLVWCDGLASWMPLGAVLGASEQPSPRSKTHTVHVETAARRAAAHDVASLSRLYVENLAERRLAPLPPTSSCRIVEAHDAFGAYAEASGYAASVQPPFDYASARHLPSSDQQSAEAWQPALAELARLVEVSEAGADWSGEWEVQPRQALVRPTYG